MEDSKYALRKSKLYWICGGDIFWYHFDMVFLKPFLIFQLLFSIVLSVLKNFVGQSALDLIAATYFIVTLLGIISIYKNTKIANLVMRSKSKPSDANWVFIFISCLCVLMLALLPFGYVRVG